MISTVVRGPPAVRGSALVTLRYVSPGTSREPGKPSSGEVAVTVDHPGAVQHPGRFLADLRPPVRRQQEFAHHVLGADRAQAPFAEARSDSLSDRLADHARDDRRSRSG